MKNLFLASIFVVGSCFSTFAQTAEQYMHAVTEDFQNLSIEVWDYTKRAKNSGDINSAEGTRAGVFTKLEAADKKLSTKGGWKNDLRLNSAIHNYYEVAKTALSVDYKNLAFLEKSKNTSLVAMTKFLDEEKRVRDKMFESAKTAVVAHDDFSKRNKLNIASDNTGIYKRIGLTARVYDYYAIVYLLTFKCIALENELLEAIAANDFVKMGEIKISMVEAAKSGLITIRKMTPFEGKDDRFRMPTNKLLTFYKMEGETHVPKQIKYFEAKKHFEDHVKKMKSMKKRTKQDVTNFNKERMSFKKHTELYNRENNGINSKRTYAVNVWNNDARNFVELNVPE